MNYWCQKCNYRKNGLSILLILTLAVSLVCYAQPASAQMRGQQRGQMQQQMGNMNQQLPVSPVQIAQGQIKDFATTIITNFFLIGTPLDPDSISLINQDIEFTYGLGKTSSIPSNGRVTTGILSG